MTFLEPLTDEQRAELDVWADVQGYGRVGWQVYDETDSTEDNYGEVKIGPLFASYAHAEAWAKEDGRPEALSIYREKRCVTRERRVWYMAGSSPVYQTS